MFSVTKPISQIQLTPGSTATIPGVSWDEFEALLEELGEGRSARLVYSQGLLEIIVSLPEHEKPKELISDMVKLLLKAQGRKYEPFGSTTFKQTGIAGIEPDACFYIQNYAVMVGRRKLQPGDPPPDLAIEIDVTSKTTLEAYELIEVPEVWIYESGVLKIYLLQEGRYAISDHSAVFPRVNLTDVIPDIIARSWEIGTVEALAKFESMISN